MVKEFNEEDEHYLSLPRSFVSRVQVKRRYYDKVTGVSAFR